MATVTKQIASGTKDAAQQGTTVTNADGALNANGATHWIGLIFDNLTELEGATINSAYLDLYFVSGAFDSPYVTIKAEYNDVGTVNWGTGDNEISGKTTTTASVTWDANNIGTGWKTSPDIAAVVQEVVDHPDDWTSGRLIIIIQGIDGTSEMRVRGYEGSSSEAAKLTVDYITSSPVTVELDTLGATAAAVAMAIAPGAVSILLDTLAGIVAAIDLTQIPGMVAVILTTLDLDGAAEDMTVSPGGVAIVLTTLDGDAVAVSLSVVPSEVALLMATLGLLGEAVDINVTVEGVEVIVVLATLAHSLSAMSLTVVPGAVAVELDTLAALLAAVDLSVLMAGTPAQVNYWPAGYWPTGYWPTGYWPDVEIILGADLFIQLSTLMATLTARPLAIVPGGVEIALETLNAGLTLNELIVFLLLGCAATGDRALFEAAVTDFARYVATAADRTGCC